MKARFGIHGIVCLSLLFGCASTHQQRPVVGPAGAPESMGMTLRSLDAYLAQQPGVTVNGSGQRARVHVSGSDYPNPPLFVIDGVAIGYDFGVAWSRAPMSDVESVTVIRANDAAASRYGWRGGNGVIEISMKRGRSSPDDQW